MKFIFARLGLLAATAAVLSGCGGGGGGGGATPSASGAAAAVVVSNTSAVAEHGVFDAFIALGGGQPVVTIASPPVVNFAVLDSAGKAVPGLKLAGASDCDGNNIKFMMAKFDAATSSWQSLITASGKPAADPVANATLDANSGYYTYHFATDPGVDKNDATIHYRMAMALCFTDPQTNAVVKTNPYFDFTLTPYVNAQGNAAAKSVPQTDASNKLSEYKKVVDKASCNECHQSLAARHDDHFTDPGVCVMCHGSGVTDSAGNPIEFKLMVHRVHRGTKLTQNYPLATLVAPNNVTYPQDQRNCVKCHDGSATAAHKTQDGNNWMNQPSKTACWGCHDDQIKWQTKHAGAFGLPPVNAQGGRADNPSQPNDVWLLTQPDSTCVDCHSAAQALPVAANTVHAIPEWTSAANYQYNIHGTTMNADRTVSVEFSVSNPQTGGTYAIADARFANVSLLVGWGSGDFTNGGSGQAWGQPVTMTNLAAAATAVAGKPGHYTVKTAALPARASGTGIVALKGSVQLTTATNTTYFAPVADAVQYFSAGGSSSARRTIVSAKTCNACHGQNINGHGQKGATGHASDTGNSTDPQVCVVCHNGNSQSSGDFKRLIHAKHKALNGNFPVMPSAARNAANAKGTYLGYTGIANCNVCHENGSYKSSQAVTGSNTAAANDAGDANPVISPKAAACSSCHDDPAATDHMRSQGQAKFNGSANTANAGATVYADAVTQADVAAGNAPETCDGCHAATTGALAPVAAKHGLQ